MGSRIYVGNLRHGVTEDAVAALFGSFGDVTKVIIPVGRDTGEPRGFAFVTMSSSAQAAAALAAAPGVSLEGRSVTVQIAQEWSRPKPGN